MESDKVIPVRVAVRCRPLVSKELIEGCQACARTCPSNQSIVLGGDKTFSYDYVFGVESSQVQIYDACVSKLLPKVFEGFNVTILAYGQTGSGKTFTMGTCCSSNCARSEDAGIIPRAVQDIFKHISANTEKIFLVRASFLEIYKEDVFDLFSKNQDRESLQIREDQNGAIKIFNLTELNVTTPEETIRLLEVGSASRSTASTNMNARSSRSHAIFTLTVEQQEKSSGGAIMVAKFHLVDLAGSERAGKTKAVGERLKEGITINQGLLSLGNVISALCDGNSHVPYRNSKLTRLLQDSLGGNSHTVMIACVSPADSNLEETLNTLRYADRARKIKNKPIVNIDPVQAEVAQLRQQLQEARIELMRCRTLQGDGGDQPRGDEAGGDGGESKKDLALVLSRNAELENENQRLSGELHRALDQLGENSERLIITELEVQKLKELVTQLSEKIDGSHLGEADGDHATSLLRDLQNSIMEFSAGEQKRRKLSESLFKVDKPPAEDDREMTTIEEESSDTSLGESTVKGAAEQLQKTFLLNQSRLEATMRRAALSKELDDLNRVLQAKEELASKMSMNDQHLEVVKLQYEATKRDLEHEIAALKKERDDLSAILSSQQNTKSAAGNKVAEQRRKRIQELEDRVSQLHKKVEEQSRMIRLKEDAERSAKKLQQEITNMKQARVQLMKRMKEESERHRRQQTERNREVRALKVREQQQSVQMARMARQNELRINVLQRRVEEALAAKNRLEAAQRRRLENRANGHGFDSMAARVKSWLRSELLVVSESKKLEQHLTSLIEERKAIAIETHMVEKQLKDPDMAEHEAECNARLQELKRSLQEHNDKIAEIQRKILDVEPERHIKNLASNVTDIVESRVIATSLFEMLVSENMTAYMVTSKLSEKERALDERQKQIERLEAMVQQMERDFDMRLTDLNKQHQEEKLVLLKHSANTTLQSNPDMDASLVEKLQSQVLELSRLQYVHDELKRKTEEVETLERALANVKGSRVEFFEDISSAKKINKRKPLATKTGIKPQVLTFQDLESSIESEHYSDVENDPDWCLSSELRQASRKRKSQEEEKPKSMKRSTSAAACKCRGLCRSGRCGCSRKQRSCSSLCSCKGECPVAQHPESDLAIPEDTLTESLPQKQLSLRSKQ
ncbi:chromosome-associated kinesin KIF4A [Dermacentor andersoni]|uniref:chromosome-associated kinesin KIF4A n=1 Tax=Dermacentor andersoni TaxID=34620 RepID=UPI002155D28D|nr:chromosome-associated kinesin KIF4-like [Dermacentor andersoni]XP_054920198.1 chromosome-associated kinesin KIF4-like [Dermacentor andersoni]